jgi:hypothetical protein
MKVLTRILSLLLAFAFMLSVVSCGTTEEDVYERVRKYLAKEYPSKEFTVIDYEKRNETSGRYVINARCIDDSIDFKIYMYSSIAITDSYSVERANQMMHEIIAEQISEELFSKFKHIKWYDVFADRAADYRFREVPVAEEFALFDIESLHEVRISENVREADIGGVIYDFMYDLCASPMSGCDIEKAVFVFKVGRYTYNFTTSSEAILKLGRDGTVYYVLNHISSEGSTFREVNFEYFSASEMEEAELEEDTETKSKFRFK